ncbi:MAG: hypothetical protein F2793_07100, partial [Actinobacteria bacterium]|nr:hypothetical protein [Actinomycetota bacterium]
MKVRMKAVSLTVVTALVGLSIVVVANEAAAAVPTVTAVSPSTATVAGGTTITVTGSGFYDGGSASAVTGVTVGGVAGTSVSVASDTSLTFVTPVRAGADRTAGPGAVVVTTSGGASSGSTLFTYRPVLQSISSGLLTLGSLAVA